MALSLASDFKVHPEFFQTGQTEILMQQSAAFGAASANTLQVEIANKLGHHSYASFFNSLAGLDQYRDITADTPVVSQKLVQSEFVSVKLNRRQGPVEYAFDAIKKLGGSQEAISLVLGQQSAKAQMLKYLNTALMALVPAISGIGTSDLVQDGTAGTITYAQVINAIARFGDTGNELTAIVMHSKPFYDLFGDGLSNYKIDTIAGQMIVNGAAASLGRPIVVTDAPALKTTGIPDTYHTLLLSSGSAVISESEDATFDSQIVSGNDNLKLRWQLEYAFNVAIKGLAWDVANGGTNPNDAAVATATNWDMVVSDNKQTAGVVLNTQ